MWSGLGRKESAWVIGQSECGLREALLGVGQGRLADEKTAGVWGASLSGGTAEAKAGRWQWPEGGVNQRRGGQGAG